MSHEKKFSLVDLYKARDEAFEFLDSHNPEKGMPPPDDATLLRHTPRSLDGHLSFIIAQLTKKGLWPEPTAVSDSKIFKGVSQSALVGGLADITLAVLARNSGKIVVDSPVPANIEPFNFNIANHALVVRLGIEHEYAAALHAHVHPDVPSPETGTGR